MIASYVLIAYAGVALGFLAHAIQITLVRARSRRRERLFAVEERLLLGIVALVASVGWPLLLPMQVIGRAQSVYLKRGRRAWRERAQWRRPTAILGRAG